MKLYRQKKKNNHNFNMSKTLNKNAFSILYLNNLRYLECISLDSNSNLFTSYSLMTRCKTEIYV